MKDTSWRKFSKHSQILNAKINTNTDNLTLQQNETKQKKLETYYGYLQFYRKNPLTRRNKQNEKKIEF